MELYEIIVLLGFLGYIGVLGYKLYNIFKFGEYNTYSKIFLGLIGGLFSWGVVFIISLLNYTNLTGITLARLCSWTLPFLFILSLIEIFIQFKKFPDIVGNNRTRSMHNTSFSKE